MKNLILLILVTLPFYEKSYSQPELQAWGNMSGIRIDGHLMKFETSIYLAKNGWKDYAETGKEKQRRPIYKREGDLQIVNTFIDSIFITKSVKSIDEHKAQISLKIDSKVAHEISGLFFCLKVPGEDFMDGKIKLIEPSTELSLSSSIGSSENEIIRMETKGYRLMGKSREVEMTFETPTLMIVKREGDDIKIYIEIHKGSLKENQLIEKLITIQSWGQIDKKPVTMNLGLSNPGRPFDGIGGNFRLQNPKMDPQVIDYCLKNLRVSWARVEMPWRFWHPNEDEEPIEMADNGKLHAHVKASMEMAQRLDKMGIPVMLAAWFPPTWAVEGEITREPKPGGLRGNAFDQSKKEKIYKSITDYMLYLKRHYDVETIYFSFNESDLGIDVRQTDKEHTTLIKELGAYMKSKGLKTTLLLGDTADANGWPFINDAMSDSEAKPFMGAVSYHSWRGWNYETLEKWDEAARKMDIPLIVGEGSIDAAAWRYPGIFKEQSYALEEIELYVRILDICEPLTILQWQLTSDYSPLIGGGLFGNSEPLGPTQRFWNLKQLGSTKKGLKHLDMSNDGKDIHVAALGNLDHNDLAFHIVNNGATREVNIKGIPPKVKKLNVYVTDIDRGMVKQNPVRIIDGVATITVEKVSFTSLMTK